MKKIILIAAVAGISMTALYASAQGGPGHFSHKMGKMAEKKFDEMDSNGDGLLSLEETLAFHEARFAFADADGDGLLTMDELKNSRKRMRFDRVDTNDDGFISEEEAMAEKDHFKKAN